jgi:serine/threonine protein kinase, bacterial
MAMLIGAKLLPNGGFSPYQGADADLGQSERRGEELDMIGRSIGTRFDDRFRLLSVLGQGAMGQVYEVADEELQGVRWALKELDLGVVLEKEKDEAISLFKQEVDILSGLSHPGCPRVIHQFTTDKGAPAFVMTRVEGTPLDLLLEEVDRPLSLHETMPILLQVCHILEHLHDQNPPVIFRDLKPSNLMLTDTGAVIMIDFGIARRYDPKKKKDTQELGTPGFCSPEQYGRGQTTQRSDIYALATTAYFLLTQADVQAYAFKFPPLTDHIAGEEGQELSKLLESMLQLKPQDRPATVEQIRKKLIKIYKDLKPNRDRSTNLLRPSLRALTELPIEPTKQLKVFDTEFFKRWFRTFF